LEFFILSRNFSFPAESVSPIIFTFAVCCIQLFDSCVNDENCPNMAQTCVRKEYRRLTAVEVEEYQAAVNAMKNSGEYDEFVRHHRKQYSPGAHYGPSFLPFHRVLVIL